MVKAAYTDGSGQRVAILGLTSGNIERLQRGGTLKAGLAELGAVSSVVIMWGVSEQAIIDEMTRHGIKLPL